MPGHRCGVSPHPRRLMGHLNLLLDSMLASSWMAQVRTLPDQSCDTANPPTASALLTSSRACMPPQGTL